MSDADELSFLDEVTARIPRGDFEAEYFPGGLVRVTMELTAEMVERVKAIAEQQNWLPVEAFAALLALGLGALQEREVQALIERNDQPARDKLDLLVRRMLELEMQHAVMKRRTWDFLKAYQVATMADGALRGRVAELTASVNALLAERDELQRRVAALEAERRRWQKSPRVEEERSPQPLHTSGWRRLVNRLRRRE